MTQQQQQLLERALVLHVLDPDHPDPWHVDALIATVGASEDAEPLAVRHALGELQVAQVVWVDGDQVQASLAARKLDALGLIGA